MTLEVGAIIGIGSLLLAAIGLMYKSVNHMKTNDMAHIQTTIDSIQATVTQTARDLAEHIKYHLEHKL